MEARAYYGPSPVRPRLTVVNDGPSTYSALPHDLLRDPRAQHGHVMTYAVLQMHWWQGGECWASHATLAAEAKCSVRQLQRYLHDLVAWGFITERRKGLGQSKAYAPGETAGQHDTGGRFNATPVSCLSVNTTPVSEQHDTGVAFNTTPVSDQGRRTEEDSPKEEESKKDRSEPVVAVGAPRATAAASQAEILAALSDEAREVLDWWRECHGKKRPPRLNPTQARLLEEAVSDLGVPRLKESVQYMAGKGVTEIDKARTAAYTKRQIDEDAGSAGRAPTVPHLNGTVASLTPATDEDRAIWSAALEDLRGFMNDANFRTYVAPLEVAGRLDDGLCLIVPPGVGQIIANYRQAISRALLDAGDPAPKAVTFKARRSKEPTHAG